MNSGNSRQTDTPSISSSLTSIDSTRRHVYNSNSERSLEEHGHNGNSKDEDFFTEKETKLLAIQTKAYKTNHDNTMCRQVQTTIQRYLKKLYSQVKFFSDSKKDYSEPCFVTKKGREKQTVVICEYLLKNMNKGVAVFN